MKPIASLVLGFFLLGMPAAAGKEFRKVGGPCRLTLPADHGAHRAYRTEWWYYTGNLTSESGSPYGFQLTFFRTALHPPAEEIQSETKSAWRTSQVFIGHAAVTDVDRKRHLTAEVSAREALDLAGARTEAGVTTVFARGWTAQIGPESHRLRADAGEFSLDLKLHPTKPAVLHGSTGYSRKGSAGDRASCYYSLTRMAAEGYLRIDEQKVRVRGTSWMDHEFSTAPLEPGLTGWDWFSLQLSDRTELMIYLLRKAGGGYHPASSGTFVAASGKKTDLRREQLEVEILDRWKSPDTGAVYPIRWRLSVSALGLDLIVRARIADQEMNTEKTTGVVYWEGSVSVQGTAEDRPLSGAGYMELTGYDRPFDAPM